MSATWTVLGAGSILPRAGYGPAGYALRPAPGARVTLFDCGPGTVRALAAAGIRLDEVERVVVSHEHPDHTLDLLTLAFARRSPFFTGFTGSAGSAGRLPRLELVGPPPLERILAGGRAAWGRWVEDPDVVVTIVRPKDGGARAGRAVLASGELALSAARTGHTPDALAWRADLPERGGQSVVFSGDTGESAAVAELAAGADLFCCECSFPDGEGVSNHLTPSGAGRLAQAAGPDILLLSHFYPSLDPEAARAGAAREFGGRIELAHDGFVLPFGPGA